MRLLEEEEEECLSRHLEIGCLGAITMTFLLLIFDDGVPGEKKKYKQGISSSSFD